jgi:hypothetical protein
MFDSSVVRGENITFGLNQVIPGWTEGLQLMTPGETRRLWIPEKLAYRVRLAAARQGRRARCGPSWVLTRQPTLTYRAGHAGAAQGHARL